MVAGREILRIVNAGPVQLMACLAEGVADVFEIHPTPSSSALGRPLSEIQLPSGCMIAAVQRGEAVRVPRAEDHIKAGDTVVAIAPHGQGKTLDELFCES